MKERWGMRALIGANEILAAGEPLKFVTLTGNEKLADFAQTEYVWRKAWPALYAALKRKNVALKYIIIPERHKSGRMHVHALWNSDVSKRWLKDNARGRGLGYQCESIPVTSARHATQYVTKYIGKDLGSDYPAHFRRVRASRNWPDIPDPDNALAGLKWEYVGTNGSLQAVYLECADRHIDLIDMETGAFWDDVDLGTIVYA